MIKARRAVPAVLVSLLLSLPAAPASATYTCKVLDVPGATWTQVWQLNNAGRVAAGSSLGGYTYSGGAWLPLPAPPAASGFTQADLNALGINDAGEITGLASSPDFSRSSGFIYSGGSYAFFDYPAGATPRAFTEPRAISPSGIVTGWAYNFDAVNALYLNSVGFVYNPAGAPGYAPGFTEFLPASPVTGRTAIQVIPGAMNAAGQFVGSVKFPGESLRYGFVFSPATASYDFFHVNGLHSAARGINDKGEVVGFTIDLNTGLLSGYVLTAGGYQAISCPELPGLTSIAVQSINNSGVISGGWNDAAGAYHGYFAYPSVVLPSSVVDGVFHFDVAVAPSTPVFLDPAIAVGYRYAIGAGNPSFASVTLPIGVGDSVYTVLAGGRAFTLAGGERLDFTASGFPGGLAGFSVVGIEPSAGLDTADVQAFVTEVTFTGGDRFTGSMAPLTVAGELADLAAAAAGSPLGRELAEPVVEAGKAWAKGDVQESCQGLAEFLTRVTGKPARKVGPLAGALAAEAQAAAAAIGCPAPQAHP
jgi:hypothetical protein